MSGTGSLSSKILDRVFPKMADFYGMINQQCALLVKSMETLAEYMQSNNPEHANLVREIEHQGDELKKSNMTVLNQAFVTPMDREDIYRAIMSLDAIMNYAKTTVREMDLLKVTPDAYTLEMTNYLREGAEAIARGYGKLSHHASVAEEDAQMAQKMERNIEKCYRRAIADLFNAEDQIKSLEAGDAQSNAAAMRYVMETFKRREVYRHLSNTGDQLAHAGGVLHDIVVQIV